MRVRVDRAKCVGHGRCYVLAPDVFEDDERGQPGYIHLLPARRHDAEQPAVVVLPVSHPYGIYQVSRMQIEESLPRDIVAFVDWLLRSSGWTVEDSWSGQRRSLQPDDICILFRRYLSWQRDVTRTYTRGLEARGIPHVLVGARTFHQREEVETLRAALTANDLSDRGSPAPRAARRRVRSQNPAPARARVHGID